MGSLVYWWVAIVGRGTKKVENHCFSGLFAKKVPWNIGAVLLSPFLSCGICSLLFNFDSHSSYEKSWVTSTVIANIHLAPSDILNLSRSIFMFGLEVYVIEYMALLQTVGRRSVECVIHHVPDVRHLLLCFYILFKRFLNHIKFLQLNSIRSSVYIGTRFHLYIFFTMFCVWLFP